MDNVCLSIVWNVTLLGLEILPSPNIVVPLFESFVFTQILSAQLP